jgi:shikimate kinase
MNVVLVGMRGSGKSTIGLRLAETITWPLVETDIQIEEKLQKPLKTIVVDYGWEKVREIEREVIREVSQLDNVVISTGGGAIVHKENTRLLKQNGIFIYLKAPIDILYGRIKNDQNRPLLTNATTLRADIERTFEQRKDLYSKSANLEIDTNTNEVNENVVTICKFLTDKGIL